MINETFYIILTQEIGNQKIKKKEKKLKYKKRYNKYFCELKH